MKITKWEIGVAVVVALFIFVVYKYYTDLIEDRELERSELLKEVLSGADTLNLKIDTVELNKNITLEDLRKTKLTIDSILNDTTHKQRDTLKLSEALKLLKRK